MEAAHVPEQTVVSFPAVLHPRYQGLKHMKNVDLID